MGLKIFLRVCGVIALCLVGVLLLSGVVHTVVLLVILAPVLFAYAIVASLFRRRSSSPEATGEDDEECTRPR